MIKLSQSFTMQVYESTDFTGLSVVRAFVRYVYNNQVKEDMHMCKLCLLILQDKIFSIQLTYTRLRWGLFGGNVLILA